MKFVFCLISLCSLSGFAAEVDQKQFNQAYDTYWSKPVEDWNKIASSQKTESYVVRKKDTLSELSEVFFGTPNYWPKIWSMNNYIGNPHLIYPGNELGFYVGSVEGSAPLVFMGERKVKSTSSIYALDDPEIKIPPEPRETKLLEQFPPSFPAYRMVGEEVTQDEQVERQFSKLDSNVMKFNLTSFLHQGPIKSYGEIKGFLSVDFDAAASFDEVYISSNESIPLGQVFTLVLPRQNVKTSKGKVLKDIFIYEYIGEVKVLETDKNGSGLFAGRITRALDMIVPGALLIDGKVPEYDLIYNEEEIKPSTATILRGSDIFGHNILGVGQTVFLSEGENQGLAPGSLLQVQQDRLVRNPQRPDLGIINKIGVIKVVLAHPNVSTGIVVSSRDFLIPGDKTIK